MSDSSVAIASSAVSMQAAMTRQALDLEMVKQQAADDQAVLALLEQAAEQQKALLPEGQGGLVDISA